MGAENPTNVSFFKMKMRREERGEKHVPFDSSVTKSDWQWSADHSIPECIPKYYFTMQIPGNELTPVIGLL